MQRGVLGLRKCVGEAGAKVLLVEEDGNGGKRNCWLKVQHMIIDGRSAKLLEYGECDSRSLGGGKSKKKGDKLRNYWNP